MSGHCPVAKSDISFAQQLVSIAYELITDFVDQYW
jgi:hypothetical protein